MARASRLRRSLEASTLHLRERVLALSLIASGQPGIKVAQRLGKSRWTISEWVRRFNASGPEGLVPGWKGHPGKKLTPEELEEVRKVVQQPPRAAGRKTGRWTGRVLVAYLQRKLGKRVHLLPLAGICAGWAFGGNGLARSWARPIPRRSKRLPGAWRRGSARVLSGVRPSGGIRDKSGQTRCCVPGLCRLHGQENRPGPSKGRA